MMIVMLQQLGNRLSNRCYICNQGNEIPEWFSCRSDDNSVKIGLRDNWLNDEFMGIAICGVVTPDSKDFSVDEAGVECRMNIIGNSYKFWLTHNRFTTSESDYLWLAYVSREQFEHDRSLTFEVTNLSNGDHWKYKYDSTDSVLVSTSTCIHARFEVLSSLRGYRTSKVIKSGIRLVYKGDIECCDSEDDSLPATDASIILHQHHNCSTLSEPDFIFGQRGNVGLRGNKSREILLSYKLEVSSFRPYGESERNFLTNALEERRKENFLSNYIFGERYCQLVGCCSKHLW